MPKFHELLDSMQNNLETLSYTINNPSEPFAEWYETIMTFADMINYNASQMRKSEIDLDKLEKELFKFYGEDSDGTYRDFEISKVKKSMREYFSEN